MDRSDFPRILKGETFDHMPQEAWNALMDVARWWMAGHRGADFRDETEPPRYRRANVIKVKNLTEENLSVGHVVAIDGSLYDPAQAEHLNGYRYEPIFKGTKAEFPDDIGRFAVMLKPVEEDGVTDAVIGGEAYVKIDIKQQCHRFADLIEDDHEKLESHDYGSAEILHFEGMDDEEFTPGVKHALVRIGVFYSPKLLFKFTEDKTASDSHKKGKIINWVDGAEVVSTDEHEMYDLLEDIEAVEDDRGVVTFNRERGRFEIDYMKCS
jgi:hypothetical protein